MAVRPISSLFSHLSSSTFTKIVFCQQTLRLLRLWLTGKLFFPPFFSFTTFHSPKNCLWENTSFSLTLISLLTFPALLGKGLLLLPVLLLLLLLLLLVLVLLLVAPLRTLLPGKDSPPHRLPLPPCQLWQGSEKDG